MSKHLQRDLEGVKREILELGALVEQATNRAITAFVERRPDLAREVLGGDKEIDDREVRTEEDCLKILALHQPVAIDLRFIVCVMKVNNDLERMGDHAKNIAERAEYLSTHEPIPIPGDLVEMADAVRTMLRESLDALVNLDTLLARKICQDDDRVDAINRTMFQTMQAYMVAHPDTIERALHILSTSRNLERVADLCTNLAEDVIFLVEGEVIRHHVADRLGRK